MLRAFWNRLVGQAPADTVERETERENMSPAEREFTGESVDDIAADASSAERLGGFDPARLVEDDEPPRG